MTSEERKAYTKGYAAGTHLRKREERQFYDQVVIAVVQHFMGCAPWIQEGKQLSSLTDRADPVHDCATQALANRRKLF